MLNVKDEEPHRTVRRTGFGRGCGPEYEWLLLRSPHCVNPGCKKYRSWKWYNYACNYRIDSLDTPFRRISNGEQILNPKAVSVITR